MRRLRGLLWRAIAWPVGGALGLAGYVYALAWTRWVGGGRERALSPAERALMAPLLRDADLTVDLDRARLRTGVDLRGIPGAPRGMALGRTVHIAQDTLLPGVADDMRLLLHELVHVAQFQRLGHARFAWEYGATIAIERAALNALEREAYGVAGAARI